MGSGEKHHHIRFQLLHLPHHHGAGKQGKMEEIKGVPKGCMAVMVGLEGEEKLEKFIVPIAYTSHPLFLKLLKEAEEEYGFHHKGPITIPCHAEYFRRVQGLIDQEQEHDHHHQHHHDHHHHHQHHQFLCFKA